MARGLKSMRGKEVKRVKETLKISSGIFVNQSDQREVKYEKEQMDIRFFDIIAGFRNEFFTGLGRG